MFGFNESRGDWIFVAHHVRRRFRERVRYSFGLKVKVVAVVVVVVVVVHVSLLGRLTAKLLALFRVIEAKGIPVIWRVKT